MSEKPDSMRDGRFDDCFAALERFYGNDPVLQQQTEDLLMSLYAENGVPALNLVRGYESLCRDFRDLRRLITIIHEVAAACGSINCREIPLFAKMPQNFTLNKLKVALVVYFRLGEESYGELLRFIDHVGLNDKEFEIFAYLMLTAGVDACRQLAICIKHFACVDNVDTDFIRSCGQVLQAAYRVDVGSAPEIGRQFSRFWQDHVADLPLRARMRDNLLKLLAAGDIEGARRFLSNPSECFD